MKFIITLLALIIGTYFGADHLLSRYLKSTPQANPEKEKELVQGMASFLEKSPDFQKKIAESGQTLLNPTPSTPSPTTEELAQISKYFGNTPTDDFFKKYLVIKKKANPNSLDEQNKLFIELSDFIRQHPKESAESMENALQSIPQDMKAEREILIPAFIHSSIIFIEEFPGDDQAKKAYLKRFIDNTQDPDIKDALESHFPDLVNAPSAQPESP